MDPNPRGNQPSPPHIPPTDLIPPAGGYMLAEFIRPSQQLCLHHSYLVESLEWPHSAFQREIEKRRIREEIIMSEIARRRALEAEVRWEMMMERERERDLALKRSADSFPPYPLGSGIDPLNNRSLVVTNGRVARGEGDNTLFQRGTSYAAQGKPDENASGLKRKAVSPLEVDASELELDSVVEKKAKEWSCALCEVSATDERGLKAHLQGKKHNAKESELRSRNYSIGFARKNNSESIQVVGTIDQTTKSQNSSYVPIVGENEVNKTHAMGKEQMKPEARMGKELKLGKMYKFWCDLCNVGTTSQGLMDTHKMGKKHLRRLKVCGSGLVELENIVNNQDKLSLEKDEDPIPMDVSNPNEADQTEEEACGGVPLKNIGEPSLENDVEPMDAIYPKNLELVNETEEEDFGDAPLRPEDNNTLENINKIQEALSLGAIYPKDDENTSGNINTTLDEQTLAIDDGPMAVVVPEDHELAKDSKEEVYATGSEIAAPTIS